MTAVELPIKPPKTRLDALDEVATGRYRYDTVFAWWRNQDTASRLSPRVMRQLEEAGLIRTVPTGDQRWERVELTEAGNYARSLRHKVFSVSNVWAPRLRAALNDEGHSAHHAYVVAVNLNAAAQALDARGLHRNMRSRSEIRLAHPGHTTVDALRFAGMITGPRVLVTLAAHARATVLDVKADGDTPLAGWFDYRDERGHDTFFRPAREG